MEPESQPAPQAEAPAPLAVEELSGVYVATKSANVRAAPATDAKIVAKLAVDQAVDATGQVAGGEWLRVSVKGKTGFVSGKLMAESDATRSRPGRAEERAERGRVHRASSPIIRDGLFPAQGGSPAGEAAGAEGREEEG